MRVRNQVSPLGRPDVQYTLLQLTIVVLLVGFAFGLAYGTPDAISAIAIQPFLLGCFVATIWWLIRSRPGNWRLAFTTGALLAAAFVWIGWTTKYVCLAIGPQRVEFAYRPDGSVSTFEVVSAARYFWLSYCVTTIESVLGAVVVGGFGGVGLLALCRLLKRTFLPSRPRSGEEAGQEPGEHAAGAEE